MPLPDYLPGRFALARGRPRDYFALEHFHYLPQRPATYADVWVVRYHEPLPPPLPRLVPSLANPWDSAPPLATPSQSAPPLAAGSPARSRVLRFDHSHPPQAAGLTAGAVHFADHDALEARWRCAARHDDARADDDDDPHHHPHGAAHAGHAGHAGARLAAVAVLSFPSFRSAPRERVLNLRGLSHRDRVRFCNRCVRTVSRVVVHPQFRSLGLASELVRTLIDVCPTRYVEASAVMARVHPFFAAAGMRRVVFDDDPSSSNDPARPAYFIFDKQEDLSCRT